VSHGGAPPASGSSARLVVLWRWSPEIVFLVVTTAAGFWAAGRWIEPFGDPGTWWSLLHRLAGGERLYRDVFLQYGPLSPYLLSFLARLVGLSPTSFLLMNWVPAILLGLVLLRAGRPYLSPPERLCLVGLLLALGIFGHGKTARLVFPYSPAAVHALIFSTLALLLLQRESPQRRDALLAGALAGLAFCAKQEIGLVALLALCAPIAARPSRARGWLVPVLAGFACAAMAGLLVVFASASLDSLKYDSHFWPIGEFSPEWKYLSGLTTGLMIRDWPIRLGGAILAFAYHAALIGLLGLLLARDARVRRSLLLLLLGALLTGGAIDGVLFGRRADPFSLSLLVALALVLAAFFGRGRSGRDFFLGFGLFAGLVATRTAFAGRLGWSSYSGVANVSTALTWVLFLFCSLPRLFPGGEAAAMTRRLWVMVLLPVTAWFAWPGARELRNDSAVAVETPRGRVWSSPGTGPLFSVLGRNLRPGERALVLPEPNSLEPLYTLRSASPLPCHMPGWLDARAEDLLLRRFATDPPDVVVLFARTTWEFGVDPFGRGFGTRLAAWLAQNYGMVARAPGGVVLRRKPAG